MAGKLLQILKEYQAFETAVGLQITNICSPHCSACESVCCRPEFCRENLDSPFLKLLSSRTPPKSGYHAARGWLTSTGCALSTGRPPVCYQFNCNIILDTLPDDQHRYLFQVLSNLVPHIGKRSLDDRHLVEIMDPAQLKKVQFKRFGRRLSEASQALQVIQSCNRPGDLAASSLVILSKITSIPRAIAG